ncbi:hypothetical protein [Microbacterium sp. 3J1]|uniref:hypothetical protein n=1 Tax=Microbacterium sp. 3J1 TaxID=861269 RepID=UPI000B2A972D|nr:hypothetical protein [Microbacterium sp. 3J1]
MSDVSGQDPQPEEVEAAADAPQRDSIAALIADRNADDPDAVGDVPAGGAGADSGGEGPVRVDPSSEGEVKDESIHNDEPGIGTRRSGE